MNDGITKEIEIGIATDEWTTLDVDIGRNPFALPYNENIGDKGIGYRGNDGKLYEWDECPSYYGKQNINDYGPTFGKDDVIGFGVNLQTKERFFTKNGIIIGFTLDAFGRLQKYGSFDNSKKWFPAVSLRARNAEVEFNFGERVFVFNICKYILFIKHLSIPRDLNLYN